eukprot:scaffold763_cov402-Prasinococcus_capsulatus_cf.AAC.10
MAAPSTPIGGVSRQAQSWNNCSATIPESMRAAAIDCSPTRTRYTECTEAWLAWGAALNSCPGPCSPLPPKHKPDMKPTATSWRHGHVHRSTDTLSYIRPRPAAGHGRAYGATGGRPSRRSVSRLGRWEATASPVAHGVQQSPQP